VLSPGMTVGPISLVAPVMGSREYRLLAKSVT